jgi:hypothetical protein
MAVRRLQAYAAAGFFVLSCASCTPTEIGSWILAQKLGDNTRRFSVSIERAVTMFTSDGTALVADVYRPETDGTTPTILVRIPFSKTFSNSFYATVVGRFWAEHGYTVVIQGTRGRYLSSGQYYPFRYERQDGIETLQWISRQAWSNGRIGMWGGSYFGYTQWVVADQTNPGPSALQIQIASTDFYGMFYPGGAFSLESALYWALVSQDPQDDAPLPEILQKGYEGFPLIEADDRALANLPFFNDWVQHSERDDYWAGVDGYNRAARLQAPVLLMAGWYDPFLPTQLEDFLHIKREARPDIAAATRLLIGPWAHAFTVTFPGGFTPHNYRLESLSRSISWFDRYLRDRPQDSGSTPISLYVMGRHQWREEQEWPLARTRYTSLYLQSAGAANSINGDGLLSMPVPMDEQTPDSFVYDPRDPVSSAGGTMLGPHAGIALQNLTESRQDVLVYTTRELDEDVEVTGPIRVVLYVRTTVPQTDFTAKLVDVHPDGSAYNVSEGILRRHYPSTLSGLKGRGATTEIEINLWPTSQVFLKRHRIRLDISSSNYPRFDRNPNTDNPIATETHPIVANQTVYHGRTTPSRLILPVIPDAASELQFR